MPDRRSIAQVDAERPVPRNPGSVWGRTSPLAIRRVEAWVTSRLGVRRRGEGCISLSGKKVNTAMKTAMKTFSLCMDRCILFCMNLCNYGFLYGFCMDFLSRRFPFLTFSYKIHDRIHTQIHNNFHTQIHNNSLNLKQGSSGATHTLRGRPNPYCSLLRGRTLRSSNAAEILGAYFGTCRNFW